jgi:hypothetical protein
MTVVEETGRKDLLDEQAERYEARLGAQSVRVGKSGFMPQS